MKFLAVIGGGLAGYTAAELAAKAGKEVVLFEQTALGGTCLNVGCIPTKTLLYSARQYAQAQNGSKYGILVDNVRFDYAKIFARKQKIVRKLAAGIRQKLQAVEVVNVAANVKEYSEERIVIEANGVEYEAENLLICTGSTNFVPPIPGLAESEAVWNSTDALESKELPQSIVIVGGGVIGMEFATLYHELGAKVTVVEAAPSILPNLDKDIVAVLRDKYTKEGIRILEQTKVTAVRGNIVVTEQEEIETDKILVCVGRRPNLQGLEALTNLEMNRQGIHVDEFGKTNLKGVYAAGDVTGKMMLAHVATRQAEVAVGRMLKQLPLQRIAYNAIPSVVYTHPEIASVGLTEQQVADFYMEMEGKPLEEIRSMYEVKSLPMSYSGRFVAENEGENGLCKVIVDAKNQTILGVHCIGNPAGEMIAAASFAVRMGYTVSEFKQVVFPHPTVSEIMRETIYA